MQDRKTNRKIIFCFLITALAFAGIIVRVFHISTPGVLNLPQWRSAHKPTIRGSILDRNGSPLTLTIPSLSVFVHPERYQAGGEHDEYLSKTLGITRAELAARIQRGTKTFAWLARQISPEIGNMIKEAAIPGVETVSEPTRVYPHGELAGQLLGFCGVDHTGLSGLESSLDPLLTPPEKGTQNVRNIVLTIDRFIQYIAEDELAAVMAESGAKNSICVMMQPQTGEILAMAANPSFDPNNFGRYPEERYPIPAVFTAYEPGSTFKIFAPSYLLENKLATLREYFLCDGRISIYGHIVECTQKHGSLTIEGILAHSCNVGMIKLAQRLKAENFKTYLDMLGFGAPTGIGLPGESGGLLRSVEKWSGLSRSMISIGYEISVTPLQLIRAASALATDGLLMQPLLVKAVSDHEGRILEASAPAVVRRVMRPDTAREILTMLRATVTEGTGKQASLPDVDVGGKTGTAHIARTGGGGYQRSRYTASFIGFLPYRQSNLVILVVIQEPGIIDHSGGTLAAPVFRRIARRTMLYLNEKIPPVIDEESMRTRILPEASERAKRALAAAYEYDSEHKRFILIPELADHQKTELSLILQNAGVLY
jgi:cell division protein FtsI/penicillin-binding protein 2